jgi:hypothetical protein
VTVFIWLARHELPHTNGSNGPSKKSSKGLRTTPKVGPSIAVCFRSKAVTNARSGPPEVADKGPKAGRGLHNAVLPRRLHVYSAKVSGMAVGPRSEVERPVNGG